MIMSKLIDTIEQFLAESDEHLEALAKKNQAMRQAQVPPKKASDEESA